ncbi:MAG TPA: DUF3562 domain-containing protein [Nitrospiria bacterium]|nr:DUF3562 domain-containing protein [Nitrospiria bacterium]
MAAALISENDSDELQNFSTIEDLARELGVPVEEIHLHYEAALKELRPTARIKAFLPILAGRQVKETVLEKKTRGGISDQQTSAPI